MRKININIKAGGEIHHKNINPDHDRKHLICSCLLVFLMRWCCAVIPRSSWVYQMSMCHYFSKIEQERMLVDLHMEREAEVWLLFGMKLQLKETFWWCSKHGPTPLQFDLLSVYEAISGLLLGNREPVQNVFTKELERTPGTFWKMISYFGFILGFPGNHLL